MAFPVPLSRMSCACDPAASMISATSQISVWTITTVDAATGALFTASTSRTGLPAAFCQRAYVFVAGSYL